MAVQLVLEQPLGQFCRVGGRGPAGIQVQFDDVGQQAAQLPVGVVAFFHGAFHPRYRIFGQFDHGRRSAVGDPAIQRVDHIPDAGDKIGHLAVVHIAAHGGRALERLLPGLDGGVDVAPPARRQQQLFPHPVVAPAGVDDQIDQSIRLQARQVIANVLDGAAALGGRFSGSGRLRFGLPQPRQRGGDAVLAKLAVLADRAIAVVPDLAALLPQLDGVVAGASHAGIDAFIVFVQPLDAILVAVGLAASEIRRAGDTFQSESKQFAPHGTLRGNRRRLARAAPVGL